MFFRPQILNSLGNLEEVDCDINISNYNFTGTIKSVFSSEFSFGIM